MERKHLLVLVRNFPPLRTEPNTGRIVKHLGRLGWTVDVLHSLPGWGESTANLTKDEEMVAEFGENITRFPTRTANIIRGLEQLVKPTPSTAGGGSSGKGSWRRSGGLRGFYRSFTNLPDGCRPWLVRCLRPALRLIRQRRPRLLLSSGPPFSTHVAGFILNRITGIPWVTLYRDLFLENTLYVEWSPWRRGFDRLLERLVVSAPDGVVTVYPESTELLKQRYGRPQQLFRTITNGYDEDDFTRAVEALERKPPTALRRFTFFHGGRLAGSSKDGRTGFALLEGMELWLARRPELRDKVRVELIGNIHGSYPELIQKHGLEGVVELGPRAPITEVIRRELSADCLLIILEDDPKNWFTAGGKIYECLRAGKPILGILGPDNPAARHITELNAGLVARYGDPADIARRLDELYSAVSEGRFEYGGPERDEFVRRTSFADLARQHAELYEEILEGRR